MKTGLTLIAAISSFCLLSCQKEPAERNENVTSRPPIIVDSSYIPLVKELRYQHMGTDVFDSNDSGYYRFSADTIGNEFKVVILQYGYLGDVLWDSTRYTYRYDTSYHLTSIDKKSLNYGYTSTLRFTYNNDDLTKIEEVNGNSVDETYNISRSFVNGSKKLSIMPYGVSTTDTVSHDIFYNTQEQIARIQSRTERKGPNSSELYTSVFDYTYNGDDIISMVGYQSNNILPPGQPDQDSIRFSQLFTRNTDEDPILYELMEKLYGKELYDLLLSFNFFLHFQSGPGGIFNLLLLKDHQKRSYEEKRITSWIYSNGVLQYLQFVNFATQVYLDSENKLVSLKWTQDVSPSYYQWQVIYW